jgi:hypothetical protein
MAHIARSTLVRCPPPTVFALLSEVERLPEYSSMTVEVRNAPSRALQQGDRFDQVISLIGKHLETHWHLVEMQDEHQAEQILANLKSLCESSPH